MVFYSKNIMEFKRKFQKSYTSHAYKGFKNFMHLTYTKGSKHGKIASKIITKTSWSLEKIIILNVPIRSQKHEKMVSKTHEHHGILRKVSKYYTFDVYKGFKTRKTASKIITRTSWELEKNYKS